MLGSWKVAGAGARAASLCCLITAPLLDVLLFCRACICRNVASKSSCSCFFAAPLLLLEAEAAEGLLLFAILTAEFLVTAFHGFCLPLNDLARVFLEASLLESSL